MRFTCQEKQTLEEQSRAANEVLFKKKKATLGLQIAHRLPYLYCLGPKVGIVYMYLMEP